MPLPGIVFLNRFTFTLSPAALMSVSPQVMSSSSASWMKMYWACMCAHIIISIPCFRYRGCVHVTYLWLYHHSSLGPHIKQKLVYIHCILLLNPLQHAIQQDEGACPTYTSTAVHQQGVAITFVVSLLYSTDESNERSGKLGHSMIRPGGKMIVGHLQWFSIRILNL